MSRLTAVTDALGNKTQYSYDTRDNLTKVKDALGRTTAFSYDLADRLVKEKDALGNQITYTYSPEGNLLSTLKADGSLLSYGYDKSGNLLTQSVNGEEVLTTAYNELGKMVTTKNQGKEITYQYNEQDYLASVDHGNGEITGYEYDALGRKTAMTYPGGDKVTYTYDTMDRLVTVTEPDGSITAYSYDALGRRIQTGTDNLTTDYTFDEVGNLITQNTTGDTALSFAYKYNQNGQIVEETREENSTSVVSQYTYDPLGQLTIFTNTQGYGESYTYDKVGNMTKKAILQGEEATTLTMAYNKGNQLTAMKNGRESIKYTYDKNGNLSQKQSGKQIDTYTYNAFDQLTGYMGYDGFTQNYTVDSYGLKVSQTQTGNTNRLTLEEMLQGKTLADVENNTDNQNVQSNETVTTDFVYDYTLPYGQLIQERVTNGSTSSITQYTYGLERISAINSGNTTNAGTKTQYVYDGRTSVAQTIISQIGSKVTGLAAQGGTSTNTGTTANTSTNAGIPTTNPKATALTGANSTPQITSFAYTPFGEQLGKVGREKITGFGFNGEYYDGATGMLNLRARQYEPTMNRFSQKDMLRGSMSHLLSQNRYGFVFNDPMNFIDSDGLVPKAQRLAIDKMMAADKAAGSAKAKAKNASVSASLKKNQAKEIVDNLNTLATKMVTQNTKRSVQNFVDAYLSAQQKAKSGGYGITTTLLKQFEKAYQQAIKKLKEKVMYTESAKIVDNDNTDELWAACMELKGVKEAIKEIEKQKIADFLKTTFNYSEGNYKVFILPDDKSADEMKKAVEFYNITFEGTNRQYEYLLFPNPGTIEGFYYPERVASFYFDGKEYVYDKEWKKDINQAIGDVSDPLVQMMEFAFLYYGIPVNSDIAQGVIDVALEITENVLESKVGPHTVREGEITVGIIFNTPRIQSHSYGYKFSECSLGKECPIPEHNKDIYQIYPHMIK